MLNPKPSSLPFKKREAYVLNKAKELVAKWNVLPPKQYNEGVIKYYLKKRKDYLGIAQEIIIAKSPKSFESSLWSSLDSSLWSSLDSSLWSSLDSSLWSSYGFLFLDSYYQFNEDHKIKNFVKYLPEAWKEGGLGFAIITDKSFFAIPYPYYELNRQMRLHKDMAPAVVWPDSSKEYYLNGVKCPEFIVMTPWDKLDVGIIAKQPNAEVRREIVGKIGIERVCKELHAETIHSFEDYELLLLDIGDGRKREYLKMINPSIGCYHIEGVPPGTRTCQDALAWKWNMDTYITPEQLT